MTSRHYRNARAYKRAVRKLTAERFPSRDKYVRDHEVPVIEGWKRLIPIDWMAGPENVSYIRFQPNLGKGRTLTQKGRDLIEKHGWERIYNYG